ncbi:hypothetical protein [Streptomyces sp. NBC_00887]|uniref:hypothetical protein n=1 Tax=Streptomyces sp. NBC_00887 TaxID=2975859 RepID=UPI002F91B65F|nr:hypothetical protein OG844_46570 [Streptomyces sp. NBC_00887]
MSEGILAAVLIFAIVVAAACYAILHLKNNPARVGAVIVALAVLVGALVPVVRLLTEPSPPAPTQVIAPAASLPPGEPDSAAVGDGK